MTAVAAVFVGARMLYRQFFSAQRLLSSDDWAIFGAILLGIPSVALTTFGLTAHGLGTDLWGLQLSDLIAFGRFFYLIQVIYVILMMLIKLSLTLFYLRIFLGRTIRALLWGTIVFHTLFTAAFAFGIIGQCLPISYQWQKYNYKNDGEASGHCININTAGWANSAISVASDIWLLALPLSQLHGLGLHWKKKLGAALMFFTGAL